MLLSLTKVLRGKRGALHVGLNLDDLVILLLVSTILGLSNGLYSLWLSIITTLFIGVYGLLIWLDALLFIQYRIEINRQTLAWFLTGSKGLSKGLPHLLSGLRKFPAATVVPILWISLLVGQNSGSFHLWLITNMEENVLWLFSGLLVAVVFLLSVLWIMRALFQTQHPFLTSPTLLTNVFSDDTFEGDNQIGFKPQHQAFVKPSPKIPKRSDLHGKLHGANVILITVESLGAYVSPYTQDAARSLLAERFERSSWVSKQHFCLCPNTTVSTNQMYTGGYSNNPYNKSDSLYPGNQPKHIEHLKQAGYKTLFLDSADIGLYDYHKLLKRIGFDKVWGTDDIPANGLRADYRLLNMVDAVVSEVQQQPFFLHLINDQTHMPYEIVDKDRFNRHKGKDAKSEYLNALEEVDFIIHQFLTKLEEKLDLSNTIVVFTGDHGESFGEYGYSFHSNSVIKPQMQVPFMLHHPKLGAKSIAHSCHFDLFPTFFDLLGIKCDYPTLGCSLADDDREFAYFFHSATLKGNSPANFGFMLNGEMLWMDRLFNQISEVSANQQKISMNAQDKRYAKNLLHKMLRYREILS